MGVWAIVIGVILILLSLITFRSVTKTFKKLKKGEITNPSPFIAYALWTTDVITLFIGIAGIMTFTFY